MKSLLPVPPHWHHMNLLPQIEENPTNPPTMVTTMPKHQRKHAKQAISRDYRNRMGKPITVSWKRSVTPLRALLVDDIQIRRDEIRLVHELRKFI